MFFRYSLPALAWAAFIFFITLMPGKYIPPVSIWDFVAFDKFIHAGVFAVLVILFMYGFVRQYDIKVTRSYPGWIALAICVPYGLMLELMQELLLSDRYFEWYDFMANVAGCVLGIIIFKFVRFKFQS